MFFKYEADSPLRPLLYLAGAAVMVSLLDTDLISDDATQIDSAVHEARTKHLQFYYGSLFIFFLVFRQ